MLLDNRSWALLLVEAALVVISVLLALALNSWREASAHHALAQRAVQTVVDETAGNCAIILDVLPYHEQVLDGQTEYKGLGLALLRNDAWSSAQSAGAAVHIEYEIASLAGAIYALQDDHRRLLHSGLLAAYITALDLDPGYAMLHQPEEFPLEGPHPFMLHDFIHLEKQLLTAYRKFLARSEDIYGISGICGDST
ncbi:MAG: hypothetical protein ACNA7E_08210 [Wenzhouxiangellaceae bacterium]